MVACGGGGDPVGPDAAAPDGGSAGPGFATYTVDDQVFRIAAAAGAAPENVSAALGAPASGDRRLVPSRSGAWLVMEGARFGCAGCLVRVAGDLSAGEVIAAGGAEVYPEGIAAITDDGARVVYPASGGDHAIDLWLTERDAGGTWSAPTQLTADSATAYNNMPALTVDGDAVVFDCGANPYPEDGGNDACRVALTGGAVERLVGPDALPGARFDKVQNPHDGPSGLLFEASWPVDDSGGKPPEIIWRLPPGGGEPEPVGAALPNSVAPCVLADGRWLVLWLGGPDNDSGAHELTLVAADGSAPVVLTPGVDVADIGLGCGG